MALHFSYVTPPAACEYLRDRQRQMHYEVVAGLTRSEYAVRLDQGWRRFGHAMFRPVCAACRMCRSIRVPAATFCPDRSQRRAWNTNRRDVTIAIDTPAITPAKRALYQKYHRYQHAARDWPSPGDSDIETFVDNPFATEEWSYWTNGRLLGVGYVDVVAAGLSAMYFYYDPDERRRSLGTFNVLSVLSAARERGLPYVYLGYYVEGCRSLEYKNRFRPNEILTGAGRWEAFGE